VQFVERAVTYDYADLGELALAWAITVHKSQGSEYPRRDSSAVYATLHAVVAQSLVYRTHTGQAACRSGWPHQGYWIDHQTLSRPAALYAISRSLESGCCRDTVVWHRSRQRMILVRVASSPARLRRETTKGSVMMGPIMFPLAHASRANTSFLGGVHLRKQARMNIFTCFCAFLFLA